MLCLRGVIQAVDGHPASGMVVDFSFVDDLAEKFILDLDHSNLNSIFDYTTAELLVEYFVQEISAYLTRVFHEKEVVLSKVRLYETEKAYVEWTLENNASS